MKKFFSPNVRLLFLIGGLGVLFFLVSTIPPSHSVQLILPPLPTSTTQLPVCDDHNSSIWHPVVKKDPTGKIICAYGHEHGDPPPQWVTKAGFQVGFDHTSGFHGNTSEIENTLKHPGMKGFEGNIKGVEVYLRIHLMSNPMDRAVRFHSYELFLKDSTGAVSHYQGWLNTGDPIIDRIPYQDKSLGPAGVDPRRRPIVWAATKRACEVDHLWCRELWSMTTSTWGPQIVWGIIDTTTYFHPGEKYDPVVSNWEKTGNLGGNRSISLTILRSGVQVGKVWATQFGQIVSGPDDPKCSQMTEQFGLHYQNICLENFIAPTLPQITGLDNTLIKQFDITGVQLPN